MSFLPEKISGGEKQRVAICWALINDPKNAGKVMQHRSDQLDAFAKLVQQQLNADDTVMARISIFNLNRDDWIDNSFTGEGDALGENKDLAVRGQLLFRPSDNFSALASLHWRDYEGTAEIFRANVLTQGSNELNENYDRETVFYNGGGNNPQTALGSGVNLHLDWDIGDLTLSSITSNQSYDYFARGDIDGGVAGVGPGFILFDSDTGGNNDIKQFTQELRLRSNYDGNFNFQVGAFYFDDELTTTTEFGVDPTSLVVGSIAKHDNTAWAVFGQGSYDFANNWSVIVGARYTDDKKDYTPVQAPPAMAFEEVTKG